MIEPFKNDLPETLVEDERAMFDVLKEISEEVEAMFDEFNKDRD